jgi:chromosome segregation ATPase
VETPKPPAAPVADPREAARRALEGEERTAKRESAERQQQIQGELSTVNKALADLRRQKEELELAWIDLDGKKKAIRANLNPMLEREKQLEEEEAKLEAEEASTGVPASRHEIEQKRWPLQAERKEIEQKKWVEEEKIIELDRTIEVNTVKYRQLLEEEDKLTAKLKQLQTQVPT